MNLTKDEILKLEAGRETDAYIGVYVFGYEMCTNGFCGQYHLEDGTSIYPKNWSTDDSAALSALDKFLDEHPDYGVSIESRASDNGKRIHDAVLWDKTDINVFAALAESRPLAICHVLLLTALEDKQ